MKILQNLSSASTVLIGAIRVVYLFYKPTLLVTQTVESSPVDYSSTSEYMYKQAYSKICLKRLLKKKIKIGFHNRISLNVGQKYCKMLKERILQYF